MPSKGSTLLLNYTYVKSCLKVWLWLVRE